MQFAFTFQRNHHIPGEEDDDGKEDDEAGTMSADSELSAKLNRRQVGRDCAQVP